MLMTASTTTPRRLALLALLAFVTAAILLTSSSSSRHILAAHLRTSSASDSAAAARASSREEDRDLLNHLGLSPTFEYRRQCITARPKRGLTRSPLLTVSHPLLTAEASIISLDDALNTTSQYNTLLPPCTHSLTIDVAPFGPDKDTNTSPLRLGMATKLSRVGPSLRALARWLPGTGSDLLILLTDTPDLEAVREELEATRAEAENLGIPILFRSHCCPEDSEGVTNFALAPALWESWHKGIKWFGLIDDDTFFLSLPKAYDGLVHYDHEKLYYIGALTEGHQRLVRQGFIAWGGAGFFVSPPLMKLLAQHHEDCKPLDTGFGDILWRDCIHNITSPTLQLTEFPGLNQLDIWGDVSGWYEAGLTPLHTVHHWKSWHYYDVSLASQIMDVAGSDSYLQRYLFPSENLVLSNGFSLAQYPSELPDLNLVELTMVEDVDVYRPPEKLEFAHKLGMMRPMLELGREKLQWKFEFSAMRAGGVEVVRQVYVKRGGEGGRDSVIELDWSAG